MLNTMDLTQEEVSRDGILNRTGHLWYGDVLFSTIWCHRNQGKNILNPIWSFDLNLTYYPGINTEVYQAWNAWSWLVGLVSPGTVLNKVNNFTILIILAGARCHKPSSVTGGTAWTVSYNCKFLQTIISSPLNANWPRWDQHHSAQSEHWDGGTRLSVSLQR